MQSEGAKVISGAAFACGAVTQAIGACGSGEKETDSLIGPGEVDEVSGQEE